MLAQIELLKVALKDTTISKFIFLSESSIPLKDFDSIYKRLSEQRDSQFRYWINSHKYRDFKPIEKVRQFRTLPIYIIGD